MLDLRLSSRAARDLLEINLYGIEQFGAAQAELYGQSIDRTLETLRRHPRMGRLAPSIGRGVRRHEHGSHVILYEEGPGYIQVLAIVHGRMRIGTDI